MLYQRSSASAGLLSLIYPGLGHLYVGRLDTALIIQLLIYGSLILFGVNGWLSSLTGGGVYLLVFVGAYLFSVWDSIRLAKQSDHSFQPKLYNSWWGYIGFVIAFQFGFGYVASQFDNLFGVEMAFLNDSSMNPVIESGEWVLINTRDHTYEPGDLVAFYTSGSDLMPTLSRVAAVGGDSVSIIYGQVYRNGQRDERLDVIKAQSNMDYSVAMEARVIPAGHIFILGDNRDRSMDSRFFGAIPKKQLVGTATEIAFSLDFSRIGNKLR